MSNKRYFTLAGLLRHGGGSIQTPAQQIIDLSRAIDRLTPEQRQELVGEVVSKLPGWASIPGPQLEAELSDKP